MSSEETKRDRVRRLVIAPMQEAGFRFRHGTDAEKAQAALDRMADALGYMSDAGLEDLRACLMTKGEGAQRCFWPAHATVLGFAEMRERRPLEEVPELLRWFRSEAGPKAAAAGRLVAEYLFWKDRKHPPVSPQARKYVSDRAHEMARRLQILAEREASGRLVDAEELAFRDWYNRLEARVTALLPGQDAA